MKKLSLFLVFVSIFAFATLNSCKQKPKEAEPTQEEMAPSNEQTAPAAADTTSTQQDTSGTGGGSM